MQYIQTIILGLLEGITEYLPISSTAHLSIGSALLRVQESDFTKSFEVIIQGGAILAVLVLYAKRLVDRPVIILKVAAGFVPTAVVGFLLYSLIKNVLIGNMVVIAVALAAGGAVIIIVERWYKKKAMVSADTPVSIKHVFYIGLAQSLAVIPGVSRAAATIVGGLMLGYSRKMVTEFSFLLAVPTIAAAAGYDFIRSANILSGGDIKILAFGFTVSFLAALATVKSLVKFVSTHTFRGFGWYRIALGASILLWIVL